MLRNCAGACKLMHIVRAAPPSDELQSALRSADGLLRDAVERIAAMDVPDDAWWQATLPVSQGGLGLSSIADIALPAYVGASADARYLTGQLLGVRSHMPSDLDLWLDHIVDAAYDLPADRARGLIESAYPGARAQSALHVALQAGRRSTPEEASGTAGQCSGQARGSSGSARRRLVPGDAKSVPRHQDKQRRVQGSRCHLAGPWPRTR